MKILIFSHSSSEGGAEKALLDLTGYLLNDHDIFVVVPSENGELTNALRKLGIKYIILPIGFSLPNPSITLLQLNDEPTKNFIKQLIDSNFDLIINNTIVTLHGMLIAKKLNIPSITYAHEFLHKDQDLAPHGCSTNFYLTLVSSLSNHILCASEYVKSSFQEPDKCSIFYPFSPYEKIIESEKIVSDDDSLSLLVIGTKSKRKNIHFAITVTKALRLRGLKLNLHIIGSENSGSYKLKQQLQIRNEKNVFIHGHLEKPYEISGKKINLICANSEPFGLTIPESLARGIPVVSSRSGGPEEILSPEFLYDINSIDECVRCLENIIKNYDNFSLLSKKIYSNIIKKNNIEFRKNIISKSIALAISDYKKFPEKNISINLDDFEKIINPSITADQVIENISFISSQTSCPLSILKIHKLINDEIKSPGSSVLKDMHYFDAVPFGNSKNMDLLYKEGLGLAIELLINTNNPDKKIMLAFILLRLQELKQKIPAPKILCLGDGLGIDSITFASCGFSVDYLDFDQSLMAKCAELNFKTIKDNSDSNLDLSIIKKLTGIYDVIISLEVIEHISNPSAFLELIHASLKPEGLLFISECFDGVYDQWPTHLYVNEECASQLPILAAPFFNLLDINTNPLGKPYLFSKKLTISKDQNFESTFNDPIIFNSINNAKCKVGF